MSKNKLSTVLTNQALKVLTLNGWYVWRQNNVGVYDPVKKVYRQNVTKKGIPDIIGFSKRTGMFIGVEVKAGKDKLSKEQSEFLTALGDAGGYFVVIRELSDIDLLTKLKD